ncbi:class I SAM-dependent methyltransferase [Thermotalea metallivorans]|uniref:Uncharacterized methyltransferase AN619_03790 n=1 Tax=Thermotalea metallivorans TaxID=520762 RepID=A0A140LB52_9FIRM|nr:class I SAM-dependent methyltransferase [Thermotalea metallivorans]KXG77777.1 putative methyltransferase [Thermotalea metallivorans]
MHDFSPLFDAWAASYDATVYDADHEYAEVFEGYNAILENICEKISEKSGGVVLEIGIGTGNLTKLLYEKGFHVIGIEPSKEMRKIAQSKLPDVPIMDGHFLSIPVSVHMDAVVTSYAFHHLPLDEKKKALVYLDGLLKDGGKIIIADTMFESEEYKKSLLDRVKSSGAFNLLKDLNTEYYEYVEDICQLFRELNYQLEAEKMNQYVWMISASKGRD